MLGQKQTEMMRVDAERMGRALRHLEHLWDEFDFYGKSSSSSDKLLRQYPGFLLCTMTVLTLPGCSDLEC
ncbi:hypothetical protein STEG23_011321 [Scotinomys teguina]